MIQRSYCHMLLNYLRIYLLLVFLIERLIAGEQHRQLFKNMLEDKDHFNMAFKYLQKLIILH